MAREVMVVFSIVAFVSGLFGVLGFTILDFRGKRLAKFVGVAATVTTAVCWGLGLLSRVPSVYLALAPLAVASAYAGLKLDEAWESIRGFITRYVRHRRA